MSDIFGSLEWDRVGDDLILIEQLLPCDAVSSEFQQILLDADRIDLRTNTSWSISFPLPSQATEPYR